MSTQDKLSHGAVHDLLTPLAVIRGQAQLIRRRARNPADPEQERALASVAAIEVAVAQLTIALNALRAVSPEQAPLPEGHTDGHVDGCADDKV